MSYIDPGDQRKGTRRPRQPRNGSAYGPDQDPSLFDAPAPSVPRETSEDAADRQTRGKRANDRTRILREVALTRDGLTRDQIAKQLDISPNTVRPRIVELITAGHVSDTRLTRLTETGSSAAVCECTDVGREWLRWNGQ